MYASQNTLTLAYFRPLLNGAVYALLSNYLLHDFSHYSKAIFCYKSQIVCQKDDFNLRTNSYAWL